MGLELDVEGFLRRIAEHRREHVAEIQRALGP
jgi:predicted metal-dependent hydrolase